MAAALRPAAAPAADPEPGFSLPDAA